MVYVRHYLSCQLARQEKNMSDTSKVKKNLALNTEPLRHETLMLID